MSFLSKSLTNAVSRSPRHQSWDKREHVTMILLILETMDFSSRIDHKGFSCSFFKDQEEATMTYTGHIFCDREYHDWSGLEIYLPREGKPKKSLQHESQSSNIRLQKAAFKYESRSWDLLHPNRSNDKQLYTVAFTH